MKLHEWLIKNKLSVLHLAKLAGVSHSALYICLRGNRPMTALLAFRIHEATNKEVALEDLIDPSRRAWKVGKRFRQKKDKSAA